MDKRPHSRACGWAPHEHGTRCSNDCPTCGGMEDVTPILTQNDIDTRRLQSCVDKWSECNEGSYHPTCCRFPKSCSPYGHMEAVEAGNLKDSDLEPRVKIIEPANYWNQSGDLVINGQVILRPVGWLINGGPNDGLMVRNIRDAQVLIAHGSFTPLYMQIGD